MKIQIEKEKVQAAYKDACDGVKEMLIKMFGKEVCEAAKPTLDDYKTIKSYEDACEVLGLTPILSENRNKALCAQFPDHYDFRQNMPKHIIALMKLEIISRALWGKDFQPKPDAEGKEIYWYPWFALYTKKEMEEMSEEKRKSLRGALLAGSAFLVRMRVSVFCLRIIAPRTRMRTLVSACAKKRQRKRNTSENNSLSCGLNIWLSVSKLQDT